MDLNDLIAEQPAPEGRASGRPSVSPREPKGSGTPKPKANRRLVIVGAVVAVVLALVGAGVWLFGQSQQDDFFDQNAILGQAPYKTPEEVQAELDRIVEEGMFNISIASVVEFADGTAPGTAYIENVPGNRYVMQVAITLDDTGETVYESKGLKPGSYIEDITLSSDLEPGNYAATATFSALDADSLEEVGKAAAKVTLSVLG